MLKCLKSKLIAVVVFATMVATLIPTVGVFADVPISNADDYFAKLPTITKDYRFDVDEASLAEGNLNKGIGKLRNDGQKDSDAYKLKIEAENNIVRFKSLAPSGNASRAYGLALNFGLYDGTNEVTSYYGTNAAYSYAVDVNINFANTASVSTGGGISNVNGSGADSRSYFILQGYGSKRIYLYQNGYKYNEKSPTTFTENLENGKYTAVYTVNMGTDIASSKGSWKLLKKNSDGNVTKTIALTQNIALAADTNDSFKNGVYVGLNCPYTDSYIEITGARFYKENLGGDASEAFANLPTIATTQNVNSVNAALAMPGKIEYSAPNGITQITVAKNIITINSQYDKSWVNDGSHGGHKNVINLYLDESEVKAANAGTYIYEADITLHNLGIIETQKNGSEYLSSVDKPTGNGMIMFLDNQQVYIFKNGLADSEGQGNGKIDLSGASNSLKVVSVLSYDAELNGVLSVYCLKDAKYNYMYSKNLQLTEGDTIGMLSAGVRAPATDNENNVKPSIDITGAKFYKADVTDSFEFNSASYKQENGKTVVTAAYDYQRTGNSKYTVIAAIYDNAGNELTAAGIQTLTIDASDYLEGTKSVNIELDYSGDMTGKSVKLFTWNSIEGMKPMFDAKPVSAAE